MMEWETVLIQEVADTLALLIPIAVGILLTYIAGRVSGLWEAVENHNIKHAARLAATWALESNLDDKVEAKLEDVVSEGMDFLERRAKSRGWNVELDVLKAALLTQINEMFDVIDDDEPDEEVVTTEVLSHADDIRLPASTNDSFVG